MKDLIIIGAGDFARETAWIVERINNMDPTWNLLGFTDSKNFGDRLEGYTILGPDDIVCGYKNDLWVVCAIGNGIQRKQVLSKIRQIKPNVHIATLIDPDAIIGKCVSIGEGSIVCAGSKLTVNINVGISSIINLNCTLGHDVCIGAFCTINPGCNISGRVTIGQLTNVGTGTQIIQNIKIAEQSNIGAGSVVIRDLDIEGTYVGVPVRKVK